MKQFSRSFRFLRSQWCVYGLKFDLYRKYWFYQFSIFLESFFDEKSISQDGIWIAGRPQSHQDPPGPRKNQKKSKTAKKSNEKMEKLRSGLPEDPPWVPWPCPGIPCRVASATPMCLGAPNVSRIPKCYGSVPTCYGSIPKCYGSFLKCYSSAPKCFLMYLFVYYYVYVYYIFNLFFILLILCYFLNKP